jgi:hypothetical protein
MTKRHQKPDFTCLKLAVEIYQHFHIVSLNLGNRCLRSHPSRQKQLDTPQN